MKLKKGMRALSVLLVLLLVSVLMMPAVSAQSESKSWIDTFDQWAGQRDMSRYNPVVEIPQREVIDEKSAQSYPGLILLDPKRGTEFNAIDAKVTPLSHEKMSLTIIREEKDPGTKELVPDVGMTQATISWYWTQDTSVDQEVTIHNYGSSAASGQVIFWSIEDGYGYSVPFSDLAPGADLTVTVPFQIIAQYSSVGVKPIAVEIKVDPTDITTWAARMPIDAIEKYNNDASHIPDPDSGENLETSDLYHFPFSEGYRVLSEAAQAVDDTNDPYLSAYQTMQYVNEAMEYNNETIYLHYIISDLYTLDHPVDGKYQGVCDEYATLYTAFTRALGIPTRFLAFTMEETATGNTSGHGIAESWDGNAWIHSDPTWSSFDNPQIYRTAGHIHINITHFDDADDSYYTQDPEDPTGDGILRYEDFRTQVLLGEVPRYN